MAKKKIELFIDINTEKEFESVLNQNKDRLICADVFCEFSGPCTVLNHLFQRFKLDWGDGEVVLLRVLADEIEAFKRFRDQSQPIFLFIIIISIDKSISLVFLLDRNATTNLGDAAEEFQNKRITKIFRGVDNIRFAKAAKQEIEYLKKEKEGYVYDRQTYNLDEASPEEKEWHRIRELEKEEELASSESRRKERQAERKRHRAELMVPYLQHLNFVLYWPQKFHAHPELYEHWEMNNIIMIGREEIQLTQELAADVLYYGDAPINEASLHMLLSGPALAICFRLLDTDKHFVSLVRRILYEDLPTPEEIKSNQLPLKTAFDMYKSYSPTKEEVLAQRKEEKIKRKEEKIEKRARRLSEMQRLAKTAIEEAIGAKRQKKEQRRLDLLKAGNLEALKTLEQEVDEDEVDIIVPEELPEDIGDEESSEEDNPDEYFPPPGLLIPGFYSPPNDIAKANGLAILFPNIVAEYVTPEPETLPPHVLVMIDISQRYKAIDAIRKRKAAILHMGIFKGTNPCDCVHLAYSIKQFDSMLYKYSLDNVKIVFMVSIKTDFALLDLMDLNPLYVSRDEIMGEEDCARLFGVGYGETYPEFEDFDTVRVSKT